MGELLTGLANGLVIGAYGALLISLIGWPIADRRERRKREREQAAEAARPKQAGDFLDAKDARFCVHGRYSYHSDTRSTFRCYAPEPEQADEASTEKIEEKAA